MPSGSDRNAATYGGAQELPVRNRRGSGDDEHNWHRLGPVDARQPRTGSVKGRRKRQRNSQPGDRSREERVAIQCWTCGAATVL